jgi:hypothetical protein
MSEEYDNESTNYTPFWPLVIFLAGFAITAGIQLYQVNAQRMALSAQFQSEIPTIQAADGWYARFGSVLNDLVKTAEKDPVAAQIAKEAIQAGVQTGIVQIKQNAPAASTNGMTTPAAPTPTPSH